MEGRKNLKSIDYLLVQGRKVINPSGGYPADNWMRFADLIRFVANERRAPHLANDDRRSC